MLIVSCDISVSGLYEGRDSQANTERLQMQYSLTDGNNWVHRSIHSNAYPLKRWVEHIRGEYQRGNYPIVIWDGYHALAKRREIFPDYKVQRDRSKSSIAYEVMDVARELADNMNCIQVRVTGAGADDVVAHMVDKIGREKISFIHSNDIDLAGFGIPTMHTKPVPDHLKLYKTLVGKSSDNVKGLRLFGPKAWEKLGGAEKMQIILFLNEGIPFPEDMLDEKLQGKLEADAENLRVLWQISNFIPITDEELDAGTTQGTLNESNIEMIRQEYLLWPV